MRRFNDPDEDSTVQAPVFRRNKRIIVAQHGSHGSWKMAYADFATSMMAFFLAMWLINMTDERAKDIIANYFNPIKLVKTSPAKKGLSDEKVVDSSTVSDPEAKQGNGIRLKKRTKKASKKFDETQIMQNPFETIDKVAAEGPESKAVHLGLANNIFKPKSVDFLDSNKAKSGEKIIDKYIADLYGDSLEEHLAQAQSTKTPNEDSNKTATDTQASLDDHKPSLAQKMEPGKETKNLIAAKKPQSPSAEKRKEVIAPEVKAKKELSAKNSKIETEIKQNLQNIVTSSKQTDLPNISMKSDKQGLHILLSDKKNVGLFSVGSTKPNKATIAVLANIAKKLNNKPVKIIINGYTDARPYKSHFYDNWQLSTARAQMAYYMLLRGGLKKSLVDHIAGYADTKLYNKADPYAAENRRIDILVVPMSGAEDKAEKPTSSGL